MPKQTDLTAETLALLQSSPDNPVTLINLMKFRGLAEYPGPASVEAIKGSEAYDAYLAIAENVLESLGARILIDTPSFPLISENCAYDWDRIIIVRYPSASAVLGLGAIPQYSAALAHREAAIAHNVTLCAFHQTGS